MPAAGRVSPPRRAPSVRSSAGSSSGASARGLGSRRPGFHVPGERRSEVARADAVAPRGGVDPGPRGHVLESSPAQVAIERVAVRDALPPLVELEGAHDVDVEPAVAVVIDEGQAAAAGLEEVVLRTPSAIGLLGKRPDLLEPDRRRPVSLPGRHQEKGARLGPLSSGGARRQRSWISGSWSNASSSLSAACSAAVRCSRAFAGRQRGAYLSARCRSPGSIQRRSVVCSAPLADRTIDALSALTPNGRSGSRRRGMRSRTPGEEERSAGFQAATQAPAARRTGWTRRRRAYLSPDPRPRPTTRNRWPEPFYRDGMGMHALFPGCRRCA